MIFYANTSKLIISMVTYFTMFNLYTQLMRYQSIRSFLILKLIDINITTFSIYWFGVILNQRQTLYNHGGYIMPIKVR